MKNHVQNSMPKKTGEHHLFILWEMARSQEARVLEDLRRSFEMVAVREVRWSAARVSENFTRFYGQKLPPGSHKEEHCGKGAFLVVLVRDLAPRYGNRQTSKGQRCVNTNTFDAKQRYREWTGGGHRVHATDNETETRHDFSMLFGGSLGEFVAAHSQAWDGRIEFLNADLIGSEGWADLKQLFSILNETVRYLVLRKAESLLDPSMAEERGDIDLLTDVPAELAFIANGEKVSEIHHAVPVGGQKLLFEFQFAGDGNFDQRWQKDMLARRLLLPAGLYAPATEDYFYSLLYHALLRKKAVAPNYISRLRRLGMDLGLNWASNLSFANPRLWRAALESWLCDKNYSVTRSANGSAFFNEAVLIGSFQWEAVRNGLPLALPPEQLISARFLAGREGTRYFSYVFLNETATRIIKQTTNDLALRDAQFLRRLNGPYFPRVFDARMEKDFSVAVFERIEGSELSQVVSELAATPKSLTIFFGECLDILEALQAAQITHRDIHVHNFLVRNGRPVLIDFGWAVSPDCACFTPDGLGDDGRPPDGSFCDVFAMGKVFAGCSPANSDLFAPLINAMIQTAADKRIISAPILKKMLREIALPQAWPETPVLKSYRRPFEIMPPENPAEIVLQTNDSPKEGQPQKLQSQTTETTESLFVRAAAFREQSNWSGAAQIYQTLTQRLPDDVEAWRFRIECSRNQGHAVLADILLKGVLMRHPEWALQFESLQKGDHSVKRNEPADSSKKSRLDSDVRQNDCNSVSDRMKREWNERAAENARYYVRSTDKNQSEEDFDASGRANVEQCVIADLPRITDGHNLKTMTMLEIGCGVGRMSKHFAHHFGQVHAIDVSGEMIRQARERLKDVSNLTFYETGGADLALFKNGTFDFVFSFIVFQHIPDRAVIFNYIREAYRVLKPLGIFKFQVQGCTDKRWMQLPKDTWHGVTITEEDVASLNGELGFDLLAKSGQGTQYSWYAVRKRAGKIQSSDATKPLAALSNRNATDAAQDRPEVSVIIPVLNKAGFTRKCLEALRKHTPAGIYEVIIWDNGSTDETPAFFQQESAEDATVRYFRSETNLGFVGGNNAAALHARGEFLVFLNNDTEPQAGWLEALMKTAADNAVGAVGAKLIYPNGKLQEAGGIIYRDASGWNYGRGQDPRDPRFNFPREVDYCSAACLLVRTELFRQLGGFDQRYAPAYYEDTDLCFALRQKGFRVIYQPRCEIIHHEGATAGQDLTKGFKQYQVANRQKFAEKWKDALIHQPAPDASVVRRASHRVKGQRILVIDPLMPMYDRASGSKRLFEMLKLLAGGGHAVTFIARNGQDGEHYAAELRQLGVEVYAGDVERMKECGFAVKGWPLDLKQLLQDTQYDTVILSFWYVAEQYLLRICAWSPRSRVLIDTVDVHFLRELRQAELYQDAKLKQQANDTYRRELSVYCRADALITVTEDDRQVLLKQIPQSRVFIVPNIHDVATEVPPVDGRRGCLFVGGFNHLPNADAVLFFYREIWPRILQRLPDARWTIVGNNPPPAVKALAGPNIDVTGYVPSVEPYLRSHLVSVAPLRYGAGMKGKIGEALANGLPVVTTPIGAEGMGLQNGGSGTLVAEKPETFADHVVRLHADRALWNQLSVQGRQHIESHFTPRCIARKLETILDWSSSFTSIILLALNQWEHTEKCLLSIARHTPEPHEVILVDNGSTDKTSEALRALVAKHPRVRVIVNRDNRGFAGGNNQALSVACGDAVVLLNNDTVVTPGWLGRMLAVLQRVPETGLVGPMSNRVSGPQLVSETGYTNLDGLPAFAEQWAAANAGQSFEVARAVGFCLLARREVISRIGGLDEQFGNGNFEDDDYCIRARLAGFRIQIAKDVFIHHTGSQTFKGGKIDYRGAMLRNWDIFRAKWELPAEVTLERGYPMPLQLPKNVALKLPLPSLAATHIYNGSRWMDKKKFSAAAVPVKPAPVAEVGRIDEARELFGQKNYPEAWAAILVSLSKRPFHPEACLLLAEIALAAGDSVAARWCAQRARDFAPGWNAAKQFLKKPLRGNAKPEWLKLPPSVNSQLSSLNFRLSVCLIVKNEEKFLAQCLKSVRALAQQIVVVDTGSTDRTVEIAKEFGAEIHSFVWCDDFAAARNAALENATGDWILMLDADEELPELEHQKLRADLKKSGVIAHRLPLYNSGNKAEGPSFVPRLFRNAPGVYYSGRVHEQVFPSLLALGKSWGLQVDFGAAQLLHHGYTKEMVRDRNKIVRNLNLLRQAVEENPADANLMMNFGLELVRSDDLAAGVVKYREAFELMSAQSADATAPELREVLLTQFTCQLYKIRAYEEVVRVLNSPLAKRGGLAASHHYALGLAQFELKNFEEAATQMRQCLAKRQQRPLSPINTDILTVAPEHCLALSLAKLDDAAGAEKVFQKILAGPGQTNSENVKLDYAKFLAGQNRFVEALQKLHEMVAANARNFAAWRTGGEIALSRAEFLEFARDWTGEAVSYAAEDFVVVAQRAEALMLGGDTAGAMEFWERVWNAEHQPRALAALILCQTVELPTTHAPDDALEPAASRAFIAWYQRLIAMRGQSVIGRINEQTDKLSRALPTAAKMLEQALAETLRQRQLAGTAAAGLTQAV